MSAACRRLTQVARAPARAVQDEVRELGTQLGREEVVWRQPFPGPGLGVRVMGPIQADPEVLRKDAILRGTMAADLYYKVWQSFRVFLPVKTVGVMGDERTYENVVALRIVESVDAMTVDWARPMRCCARFPAVSSTRSLAAIAWYWISVQAATPLSGSSRRPELF